ncbi:heavy-metal-associated domain-containing protein [Acidithiobacillus sp. CV18-2]|uniref:Heavy-metal-associated domain-containing protein n=2 Tax=Igneacidithiobacillus copahuensis TaxID=2724909 RepID=A0AAE3CJ24_9PROT|nr:heavy-metal-associated domain-containing protein [Acidithiobacillus sp. CV18-3]MBU2757622.1 heavy-metal-associated domain-containing protein [Acidithiobacillus sp. BN09-2]MBU2777063.1 heavy-metal-associated domain-containing protein [Acidithiobacillus sp. CV18-2]MBU2787356.1 heavy-metal-associated domain-containing protein [Igneacidithiobacillus copahuensis]MBU2797375.1 heavy-metal-associated domain-containing protein [Acidithiobacillus sp. VAN18-2]MBU2799786.1 heavy-metal-associated domain
MAEMQLKVTGMTCEHCVRAATQALQSVPGVEQVEVSLPDSATVVGDVVLADLQAALAEEGYEATLR